MTETPWLTIEQTAERLQVSVRTVERMVAAGRLKENRPHDKSRARRYHVDDVDAAMQPTEQALEQLRTELERRNAPPEDLARVDAIEAALEDEQQD